MSKIFTYEELRKNFPATHRVVEARNILHQYLTAKGYPNAVLYGSSAWSLNPSLDHKHSRRSDIDIAIFKPDAFLDNDAVASERNLEDICSGVPESTGVSVDFSIIGERPYLSVNPSTADHFGLLAQTIPGHAFTEFKEYIDVSTDDRLKDLIRYLDSAHLYVQELMNMGKERWMDPKNLELLSKVENFPDHIARKFLGMVGALPCPDSKDNVRRAFMEFPLQGHLRAALRPVFGHLFAQSAAYERLIDATKKDIGEKQYYAELMDIRREIVRGNWIMIGVLHPGNLKSLLEEDLPEADLKEYVGNINSRLTGDFW